MSIILELREEIYIKFLATFVRHEVLVVSLTTPVPKEFDSAFPSENWFFYWKTSASLWKTKLAEFPGTRIVVPINWAFHSDTGDKFDFGELRPETNLLKLVQIAEELSRDLIFFFPLGAFPFLANGGLPHLLAKNIAVNGEGLGVHVIDSEDNLIKIPTFFDPKVFEAYQKFTHAFGEYFRTNKIASDVWAINSGYFSRGCFTSYLEDHSNVFESSFERYLHSNKKDKQNLSPIEFSQEAYEYNKQILDLYFKAVKESFHHNLEGHLNVAFIGGSSERVLKKLFGSMLISDYADEVYESLAKDIVPCSALVPHKFKIGVLGRELNDLIANTYLPLRLSSSAYDDEDVSFFRTLSFFKVYEKVDGVSSIFQNWKDLELWNYLKANFGWNYKIVSSDTLSLHENRSPYQDHVSLFHGHDIDRTIFQYILKAFMNGGKIILNKSGLTDEYVRKFETFYLENSLNVEKVNHLTMMENVTLGDGRLLMFDGEALISKEKNELIDFWKKIISTFDIVHVPIENADGVDYFWRTRASKTSELKFEEVRRLSLYNSTSYRKKIRMKLMKNFIIYKVIDEINVIVQTFPNEVEVELAPDGSVVLDFGVFS